MKVKEVADLVGISVRTLHHYDEIGLLAPDQMTNSGYRVYSDQNLETLQQILLFRELGLPLKEIKEWIQNPSFDRLEALRLHRSNMLERRDRLDQLIATLDKTILHEKGEIQMSHVERFKGFNFGHNAYEREARERYGDKAIEESTARMGKLSKGEQEALGDEMNAIYWRLSDLRDQAADSDAAQAAIKEWYIFLNRMGNYSLDAFKNLGQMYVDDERFTKNIDQFGEGLAQFMRDAMAVFAEKQ